MLTDGIHRRRDPEEVLEELDDEVLVGGIVLGQVSANSSMFWLNSAIHAVPSACSRRPPVGRGALRSKTPMLSRPRKPPSNTLRPLGSLRLTHHVKLSSSFGKTAEEREVARSPLIDSSIMCTSNVAKAWTGGFTSPKFHS